VGSAAAHAKQETRPVRVLPPGPVESGQLVVGDLVVAGRDVHNEKATVVVALDRGADVSLVDFAPESGYLIFVVPRAVHHSLNSIRAATSKGPTFRELTFGMEKLRTLRFRDLF
jgi:hypothetical protein